MVHIQIVVGSKFLIILKDDHLQSSPDVTLRLQSGKAVSSSIHRGHELDQ